MNFSWAFIFDTTGYVVKALPLTLFLTIFPVTAGLVLGFLLALLKMYRVPVAIHLRFLFPEHSTSGAAFPGFLRDSETDQFYLLRWGTCLGFH